jgi:transcriptional regulator with XRE-family HTH domain
MKQIRRSVGKYLKKLREERRMSLNEVIAYLQLHRIKCSKSNLGRIEQEDSFPRSDVLAGLALIYEVDTDSVLYRG